MSVSIPATAMLLVADTGRLHLSADGRHSICRKVRFIDPRDLHEPDAGPRVWEDRARDRCAFCERRLEGGR